MNNRTLNNIISEEINRYTLRQQVRSIVSEEVNRYISSIINEDSEKKKSGEKSDIESIRSQVVAWLKGEGGRHVKQSTLAYTLWPDMDEDSARRKFSLDLQGERPFSDEEVLKLYELMGDI